MINNVMLVGLGAIGCVYAKLIMENGNCNFYVPAKGEREEKIRKGFFVNGKKYIPGIADEQNTPKADLLIFAVKNYQLEQAIEDVCRFVDKRTILIPFLNGITARDEIKNAFPSNTVLYGVALEIDALREGMNVVNSNDGIIEFGEAKNELLTDEVKEVKGFFDKCGIANNVAADMKRSIWRKWMINVAANQLSAVTGATDPQFMRIHELNNALHNVMREVINVAKKYGVDLSEKDIADYDEVLRNTKMESKTSMLQDIEAKRKTEVDYFAGTVMEYGKRVNVPTPYNELLYMLIKTLEKK